MTDRISSTLPMELLAPAGDWDALLAGLSAGADAAYLGGKTFSARQFANNFDLNHIQKAVELFHLHHKKIYVTVNTLIGDSEMEVALKFLEDLYNAGVDAVIIQDLGLINLAHKNLPQLELHGSTQMTIHNSEGAQFLTELGIKRVVLARELTKDEVQAIVIRSGTEVEVFIHGALCICYSGQCLMSSMIGGRSGNRGRCAQPCRLEYQLLSKQEPIPAKGRYLLSPKDIALISNIPDLEQAGVRALKIEGRMKRPEYVYSVVKVYRRVLDRFYRDPDQFQVKSSEIQDLEGVFNRGFTSGYFNGNRNQELMSFNRPNNRGLLLGRVIKSDWSKQFISVKLDAALETGDVVEIWVSQGGRASTTIQSLNDQRGNPILKAKSGDVVSFEIAGKVKPGDRVFKVFSAKLDMKIRQTITQENELLKIPCQAEVSGVVGQPMKLIYFDDAGNSGSANSQTPLQPAINRPLTMEMLFEQLGRLGSTSFRLTDIISGIGENVMIPISELNTIRRQAIEQLSDACLRPYKRDFLNLNLMTIFSKSNKSRHYSRTKPLISVWVADLAGVKSAVEAGADIIYIGGDELTGYHWRLDLFGEAIRLAHDYQTKLIIGMPRINREDNRQNWQNLFQEVVSVGPDGLILSELGSFNIAFKECSLDLYLNYPLNVFNSWSFEALNHPRVKQICISPELTLKQIEKISNSEGGPSHEFLVQGPLELMVSEYCPIHSIMAVDGSCNNLCKKSPYFLKDRLNFNFPVYTDQFCRMHLLNSKDLCLIGDLYKFSTIAAPVFRLELKTLPSESVRYFVEAYRQLAMDLENPPHHEISEQYIQSFQEITGRGITKGQYFRGVE